MIASILGISLLATTSVMAQKSTQNTQPKVPLQDSKKAVEFFQNELNFKTNPYGVNKMIEAKAKNVSIVVEEEVKDMTLKIEEAPTDMTIVDVRSAEDFAKGHIPGAINLPFEKYDSFTGSETDFPGLTKDKINIVYCYELLCNLAEKAAMKFASLGYPVKEMAGGYEEWKTDKYPIVK